MKAYETSTTVEHEGEIRLAGVPFAPGTEVEVTVSPKRKPPEDFSSAWARVTSRLRALPGVEALDDDAIRQETDKHRAGQ